MSTRTMGISVTDVHAAYSASDPESGQKLPLGFQYCEPADATNNYQERIWIYIEAGGALAKGEIVMRADGAVTAKGVVTTGASIPAIRCLGVAQHTIASGSFGFILKKGLGEVAVHDTGEDQANKPLVTQALGRADVFADGSEECIIAFSTENQDKGDGAAAAGQFCTSMINCPG
ncbi:MAG: hypothetical protein Unbinned80contig1000_13 [Prokaryotic dsDNA virus sp.]|nr:MAG: hypothetical protein Unbinned80contig1000_13 [Prokaryotic dsDNA virus sp.]